MTNSRSKLIVHSYFTRNKNHRTACLKEMHYYITLTRYLTSKPFATDRRASEVHDIGTYLH